MSDFALCLFCWGSRNLPHSAWGSSSLSRGVRNQAVSPSLLSRLLCYSPFGQGGDADCVCSDSDGAGLGQGSLALLESFVCVAFCFHTIGQEEKSSSVLNSQLCLERPSLIHCVCFSVCFCITFYSLPPPCSGSVSVCLSLCVHVSQCMSGDQRTT